VAVLVHGGFWQALYGRRLMNRLCADLAGRGWAAWNVEYRRLGLGGGWPATFHDVASAVDALAEQPHLHLDRVVAIGHSAGGHLALWVAARHRLPAGSPGASPRTAVSGAVSLAGVLDLVHAADHGVGGSAVRQLLGGTPAQHPDRYVLASPVAQLPLGVPQLVVHGEADYIVPPEMSRWYAEQAAAAGDEAQLEMLAGVDHMTVITPDSPAWARVLSWLG